MHQKPEHPPRLWNGVKKAFGVCAQAQTQQRMKQPTIELKGWVINAHIFHWTHTFEKSAKHLGVQGPHLMMLAPVCGTSECMAICCP